ncbi:MAG: META domain-containing protein [Rikenellaceae bacterium]
MRKIGFLTILLIAVYAVTACCPCRKKVKNPLMLESNAWGLVELNSNQKIVREDNNSFVMRFDDAQSQVNGMAQCNNFFGSYEVLPQGKIKFGDMGVTRAMCQNMELEDDFLRTIADVNSYTIDGDVLLLLTNGEVVMIFNAIPAVKGE